MKKLLSIFAFILCLSGAYGQTTTENYIKSTTYQVPTTDENVGLNGKIETIGYFDGLGRIIQSTAVRAGGNEQNITSYSEYNPLGIQTLQYLPWASNDEPLEAERLDFLSQSTLKSDILSFYNSSKFENTLNPYSETHYNKDYTEKLETGAPGNSWAIDPSSDSDHTIKYERLLCKDEEVLNFTVSYTGAGTEVPVLEINGYFNEYDLFKKIIKNENWTPTNLDNKTVQSFTNKQGQLVLKRNFNNDITHDTYYIYDDYGDLAFVLSPEASLKMLSGANLVSGYQTHLDQLGYQYIYDHRNRLVQKKVPGRDWEYILYDRLDRPVLTQTSNQRSNNEWSFVKYDKYSRISYTGLYNTSASVSTIKSQIAAATNLYEEQGSVSSIGGTTFYYTNQAYPSANIDVLTINYYDNYIDDEGLKASMPSSVYGSPITLKTKGLPLVTKTKVLDYPKWITTVTGFDKKARPIYVASLNNFLNTLDIITNRLDFAGKIMETNSYHEYGSPNEAVNIKDLYTYDHMGRLKTHMQQIEDQPIHLISQNHYDELGVLDKEYIGGELFESGYTDIESNTDVSSDGLIKKQDGSVDTWNGGLATIGKIETHGGLRFKMSSTQVKISVGLNDINGSTVYTDTDYGFVFSYTSSNPNFFRVRINGAYHSPPLDYNLDDTFAVEKSNNIFTFYHNNELIYTYNESGPSIPLIGDVNMRTERSSLRGLQLYATAIDTHLQKVDYAYNVRGWLTDINDVDSPSITVPDLFNFRLSYDTSVEGGANFNPLFNGNISQSTWNSLGTDTDKRGYFYEYDDLNRLVGAVSKKGSNLDVSDKYSMDIGGYDRNGNIISLNRNGVDSFNNLAQWDDLSYIYVGNQLKAVSDLAPTSGVDEGFYDGNTTATDYTYDNDGNMISDANKSIGSITYNHLDLPKLITVTPTLTEPGGTIQYVYDASGIKLSKKIVESGVTTTTEYAGNYKYVNGDLQFFSHAKGYVNEVTEVIIGISGKPTTITSFGYVYQYTDHLGNVRLSYSDADKNGAVTSSEIIEESHYYPFGLKQKGYNDLISGGNDMAQNYKFGGKEYNQEIGLDWYDVSARNYDPALGRWMNIDPLAEKMRRHSPYNYAFDNPIYFIDYDGMSPSISPSFGNWLSGGNSLGSNFDFMDDEEPEEEEEEKEEDDNENTNDNSTEDSAHEDSEGNSSTVSGNQDDPIINSLEQIGVDLQNSSSSSNNSSASIDSHIGSLIIYLITKRLRHLTGPDAISVSVNITTSPGVGTKGETGYIFMLKGKNKGKWFDGASALVGVPTFSAEVSITTLFYSGPLDEMDVEKFTGSYYEADIGADVGISVGILGSYSRIDENRFVLGLGINIGAGWSPTLINGNFQTGTLGTETPFKNKQ